MAFGWSISSPDINQSNSCHVRLLASLLSRGQRYLPIPESRLYIRTKPVGSHNRSLILSHRFPQKRNSAGRFGSMLKSFWMIAHSPSMDFLKSVYPVYPNVRINRVILTIFLSSSFLDKEIFTHFFTKKMRITYFV